MIFADNFFVDRSRVAWAGQEQRQRPQDKKPHDEQNEPDFNQVEIDPVDDLLEELEQLKKKEQKRCGCWE